MTDEMSVLAEFRGTLARLVDRFGRMTQRQLTAVVDGRSRAAAGRELAGRLAGYAGGMEERSAPAPPAPRQVPDVGAFSVGDQLAVVGYDLVLAYRGLAGQDEPVWDAGARRPARDVVADALAHVAALHREVSSAVR